jgi:AcrR family transcriptional regulator
VIDPASTALVDAVLETLQGSDQVDFAIDAVLRRAGSNRAAFYALFGSKDRLLLAAVGEAVRRTVIAIDSHLEAADSPAEAVEIWVRLLLGRAGGGVVSGWTLPFALDAHRLLHRFPDAEELIRLPLQNQVQAVLPADSPLPTEKTAEAIYAMVMNLQAIYIARGRKVTRKDADTYVLCALRIAGLEPVDA